MKEQTLLNKNYVETSTWKAKFDQKRPLYLKLVELLKETNLEPTDKDLVTKLTLKFTEGIDLPIPIENKLGMSGKAEIISEIQSLLKELSHIELYESEASLQSYIEVKKYSYTKNDKEIEIAEFIRNTVKGMKHKLMLKDHQVNELFKAFGYDSHSDEFQPYIFSEGVEGIQKAKDYAEHLRKVS